MADIQMELIDSYNGQGFAAQYSGFADRAAKDSAGHDFETTYAKTADLSNKADKSELPTNKSAAQGGTDDSLVTTGDKYVWNDWVSADTDIPPINGVRIKGKTYEYKKLGNLLWMIENLKYDINDSANLKIRNDQYFYRLEYLYGEDFTNIIPDGWRIPTQDDRLALAQVASASSNPYKYYTDNCNLEQAYLYNGYGTFPGSYISDWDSLITTKASGGAAGGILIHHSDQRVENSGNLGGNQYQIAVPIRFVKDAPIGA